MTSLVHLTDLMMIATVISVWFVLVRARRDGWTSASIGLSLTAAFAWGAAWSWWPPLAAMRLAPPPLGQAGAILCLVIAFVAHLAIPDVRRFFRSADLRMLVWLGPWRLLYGALLLLIGRDGGLPSEFFWSAGLGDIFVGSWAVLILSFGARPLHLLAWNLVGLLDLLQVLALGAMHLRPFFMAHPDLPALNLLPLVGVPIFLALHIMTLWALARRRLLIERSTSFS